jgi:hypothetical protein
MAYYLIIGKVLKNYTKGECTLDAIAVAEFTKKGAPLNWCKYMFIELFQACTDVHEKVRILHIWLLISSILYVEVAAAEGSQHLSHV